MKGRKGGSIRLFHFLGIMLFLFLLAGISHVWVNFKRIQIGYTLSQLKKEIIKAEEYNRKLKLEIAFLKSYHRFAYFEDHLDELKIIKRFFF